MADESEEMVTTGGTIIRSADGSIYFLRDEVLEACRVTEEDALPFLNEMLDAPEPEVGGFVLQNGNAILRATSYNNALVRPLPPGALQANTSMCAGNMKWFSPTVRFTNYNTNFR